MSETLEIYPPSPEKPNGFGYILTCHPCGAMFIFHDNFPKDNKCPSCKVQWGEPFLYGYTPGYPGYLGRTRIRKKKNKK